MQDAKITQKPPSAYHRTTSLGYVSATKAYIDNRKKLVKQQYLLHMSSQYGELWPTNGWDRLATLGYPSKFKRVSRLSFATAPTSLNGSQPNFAQCLAVSWAGTLYIHFWGCCPRNGILTDAKFTLHASLVFFYIGSVTAWHLRSGRQPICGVVSSRDRAAIPFNIEQSNCLHCESIKNNPL